MQAQQEVAQVVTGGLGGTAAVAAYASNDLSVAIFGVQMAVVLAAFAGAMIALTFVHIEGRWKAALSVVSGTVGGAYLAPLMQKMAGVLVPGLPVLEDMDKPVAFLLGLAFQIAVPVLFARIKSKGGTNA